MESPLKSKVLSAYDYRALDLSAYYVPFSLDEEALQDCLLAVRKKFPNRAPVSVIQEGDLVTLSCESETPKFQKTSVSVCVGKKLYSKELEAQLVGMSVGETSELLVDGAPVTVHVLKAERSTLPELTDAFVAAHFETVHTVAELKKWYVDKQREQYLEEQAAQAADFLCKETIEKSSFSICEADLQSARETAHALFTGYLEANGIAPDALTDEQAEALFGFPDASSYLSWLEKLCEDDVLYAALGMELLLQAGQALTQETYAAQLASMSESEGVPQEALKKQYTFDAYVRQTCSEFFTQTVNDYAAQLMEEMIK